MSLLLPGLGTAAPPAKWIKPSSPKPGIVVLSPIWGLVEWIPPSRDSAL